MQEAVKEKSFETLMDCLGIIEETLSGVHAVGNQLTIVDVFLYVMYRFSMRSGLQMDTSDTKYTALVRNLYKLESTQATLEADGVPSFVPEGK
jgi:glutathione S-transferase